MIAIFIVGMSVPIALGGLYRLAREWSAGAFAELCFGIIAFGLSAAWIIVQETP